MNNQTGGLFGGLIIVSMIGLAVVWDNPQARAWLAGLLSGTPATSAAGAAAATNPALVSQIATPATTVQASTSQPYQLVNNPITGLGIQTAATIPLNEAAAIPLPGVTPLAPTTPTLSYA